MIPGLYRLHKKRKTVEVRLTQKDIDCLEGLKGRISKNGPPTASVIRELMIFELLKPDPKSKKN